MKRYLVPVWVLTIAALAQAPAPSPKREIQTPTTAVEKQEAQALTQDITRMKTLLQQMEVNLPFVTNTQSPLKHQFELEIEMWRVVLDGMERRARAIGGGPPQK